MKNWIFAIVAGVMGILLALGAIPTIAWIVRVIVNDALVDNTVTRVHDTLALAAVVALILVSVVRVVTVIGRTDRWSSLGRSIIAWDGMIAVFFLIVVLEEKIPWFQGPWELPVLLVARAAVGVWGVVAILRADPPPMDAGPDGPFSDSDPEAKDDE